MTTGVRGQWSGVSWLRRLFDWWVCLRDRKDTLERHRSLLVRHEDALRNEERFGKMLRGAAAMEKDLALVRGELREAWAECRASEAACDVLMNDGTASGLSPAELERLALLGLAAGKLGAAVAKVMLFGWKQPDLHSGRPGYADIEHGLGQIGALAELMVEAGDARGGDVHAHLRRAKVRIAEQVTRQGLRD